VDPELLALLDSWPELVLTAATLPAIRAEQRQAYLDSVPDLPAFPDLGVTQRLIPGPAGAPDVRVLLVQPKHPAVAAPALVWIHGGGYVFGAADADTVLVQTLVREIGCVGVIVDYRLAPESPHPAPVEDCYAALRWLHSLASDLGVDPRRIAVAGASAGGGLAAGLSLLARDRAELAIAFQLLIYPMLDDRTAAKVQPDSLAGEFIWTPQSNAFGWSSLLGGAAGTSAAVHADVSPYAAPARADHLAGLPPTYLDVGTLDLFFEEDLEYARRLVGAGVPTELHVYPGAFHGYQRAAESSVAITHQANMVAALRRGLAVGAPSPAAAAQQ